MKKIKVLMVTPYLPYPPYSGGQTRSFNLLTHLAEKCDITLFSFTLPDQESEKIDILKKYCSKIITIKRGKTWKPEKVLFTGLSPYPFLIANYFSPKLKKMIKRELSSGQYHLVHVECFYLMPNIPKTKIPVLLVDQTIEFAVYQHYVESLTAKLFFLKPLLALDVAKLKFWEKKFWKQADSLVAVSKEDQMLMERLSKRKVEIVPNGVNEKLIESKKTEKYSQPTILYGVANFKWIQNKEGAMNLLKFVWPKIREIMPQVRLLIAGRHSVSFINSVSSAKLENVTIKEVKNPSEVYHRSWLLVAPMKSGGGSRTKFFEAMACGLPIVTTTEGIEGIEAKDGKEVIISQNLEKMAEDVVKLLKDKQLRERIGENGKILVKEKYSWHQSAHRLLEIYQNIAQNE